MVHRGIAISGLTRAAHAHTVPARVLVYVRTIDSQSDTVLSGQLANDHEQPERMAASSATVSHETV